MTRALLVTLSLCGATACMHAGHAAPEPGTAPAASATAAAGTAPGGMAGMCPMSVPGTRLSAEDTPSGESLTFTTSDPERVSALRERVHAMAAMHARHHAGRDADHGAMHGMHGGMAGMQMPPPSQAAVEDVPQGARLVVTPNDPADLQTLQSTVRQHATYMQEHGCPAAAAPSTAGAQRGS